MSENLIALFIVLGVSVVTVVLGIKKSPEKGILLSLGAAAAAIYFRHTSLAEIGFAPQAVLEDTIGLSLIMGVWIAVLGIVMIDPFAEKVTGKRYDYTVIEGMRSSFPKLILAVLVIWINVAVMGEFIFRGFLMTEITRVLGTSGWALMVNIVFSSVVYGLAHWYQGRSGMLRSGMIGLLISSIFVYSQYNLLLVILIHGFIDTTYLVLTYREWDRRLHEGFWNS